MSHSPFLITKTIARDLPDDSYLEITAEERDGSGSLSAGFSITGTLWKKHSRISGRARKRMSREQDASGCLHREIITAVPAMRHIVAVHLADQSGLPLHAKANGWYFYSGHAAEYERQMIAEGRDYGYSRNLLRSDHQRAAHTLHIAPELLPAGLDEAGFNAFVDSLAPHYQRQVDTARAAMRGMVDGTCVEHP